MRIAAARLVPYRLPLKRPWVAAATVLHERQGCLLVVESADGCSGRGDCAPLPSSGPAGHARVFAALAALVETLPGQDDASVAVDAAAPPELRWALETALADIAAQRADLPLALYLSGSAGDLPKAQTARHAGATPPRLDARSAHVIPPPVREGPREGGQNLGAGDTALRVPVNAALGALSDDCLVRATTALAQGYAFGKLKLGVGPVEDELARLRELHAAAPGLRLRLDANRAWSDADARRFLAAIVDLPIDAAEEPLAQPTAASLAALQRELPFAIAVDESLPSLGAEALFAAGAMRRLVLKPARIGGIAATRALVARARDAGVDTVLTSVVDSAVGVTAAAHLAAAISPGLAHGLATLDWLAADVAEPPPLRDGALWLADAPGLGLRLHDAFA